MSYLRGSWHVLVLEMRLPDYPPSGTHREDLVVTIHEFAKIIGPENITFGAPILIDDFVLIVAREPSQ